MMKLTCVLVSRGDELSLEEMLTSYAKSAAVLEEIIVVALGATDNVRASLRKWLNSPEEYDKRVINLRAGCEAAQGFSEGLTAAIDSGAPWVWVADEQTLLAEDTLSVAQCVAESVPSDVAVITSAVTNGGGLALSHRLRCVTSFKSLTLVPVPEAEYDKEEFTVDAFTYTGVLINGTKLAKAGTTDKRLSYYHYALEHALRLKARGKIICHSGMKVRCTKAVHQEADLNTAEYYYWMRNWYYILKEYFSLVYIWQSNIAFARNKFSMLTSSQPGRVAALYTALTDAKAEKLGQHYFYHVM